MLSGLPKVTQLSCRAVTINQLSSNRIKGLWKKVPTWSRLVSDEKKSHWSGKKLQRKQICQLKRQKQESWPNCPRREQKIAKVPRGGRPSGSGAEPRQAPGEPGGGFLVSPTPTHHGRTVDAETKRSHPMQKGRPLIPFRSSPSSKIQIRTLKKYKHDKYTKGCSTFLIID